MSLDLEPRTDVAPEQGPDAEPEPPGPPTIRDRVVRLGRDRRALVALSVAVPAIWGLVAGWWTPRGPLTSAEALAAMAIGLLVGGLTGLLLRSRWAMLLAPAVFVTVFELARLDVSGPAVDMVVFSEYGLYAFVTGRLFHGVLALAPMVLGAALGAAAARRIAHAVPRATTTARVGRIARRTVAVGGALALVAVAAAVARPPSTAPIVDAEGDEVEGSISELTTVEGADGHEMGLMLRGSDTDDPVLLFLAGGPGGAERGAMRNHLEGLEDSFVVATWDQRGAGTSYDQLDPTSTVTLEGYLADTLAVTDQLRERFDQDRIYLMGQSWGSLLGVLAVQEAPDRYAAYIGTGQMVSPLATDTIFYEDTLAWAEERGDAGLVDELEAIGPPPYDRMLDYETALSHEHEVYPYDHTPNSEGEAGFSENFIVPEHSLLDQVHMLPAFMDTFAALYPQVQDLDLRETATELEVPVFFVQGAHEADGRAEPFAEWYATIDAPIVELVELDTSGHRPLFEQPDETVAYLEQTVLAMTGS